MLVQTPECLLVGAGDNGDGHGGRGGGDDAESLRDGEEAEISDIAGLAANGDDVGESEADKKENENHSFDKNAAQNAGL